jgi:hypothetical protein
VSAGDDLPLPVVVPFALTHGDPPSTTTFD